MFPNYNQGNAQDSAPSCMQLIVQPAQFSSSQIPPCQAMADIPAEIQRYTQTMAVLVGNEIGRQAQVNPAYTFLFNSVAGGNYNNQLWHQIVGFSTLMLWYNLQNKQGVSIESALSEAAATTVVLKASSLAAVNNLVFGRLQQDVQMHIRDLAQQEERLRNTFISMLNQYKQQFQRQQNPQQMGGIVGMAMAQPSLSPNQNPYGQPVANTNSSGLNTNPMGLGGVSLLKPLKATVKKASYPYNVEETFVQEKQTEPVKIVKPQTVTQLNNTGTTTVNLDERAVATAESWLPFPGQMYKPAFNSEFMKLTYEIYNSPNGPKRTLAIATIKDENEMNESEHEIPTVARHTRQSFVDSTNSTAGDRVHSDLDLLAKGMSSSRVNETTEQTVQLSKLGLNSDDSVMDIGEGQSLKELVNVARRLKLTSEGESNVFFSSGRLCEHVISSFDFTTLVEDIAKCTNIKETILVLTKAIETHKKDQEMMVVINSFNVYLTEEINYTLQTKMGLTEVYIESACDDFSSLVAGLKDDFGILYQAAFIEYSNELIQSIFGPDHIVVESLTQEIPTHETKYQVEVGIDCCLDRGVGVILLNMTSDEFGINIKDQGAFEIFDSNFPGLHSVIKGAIEKYANLNRIFMVTVDNKVYGVNRSIMGDNPVVIYSSSL